MPSVTRSPKGPPVTSSPGTSPSRSAVPRTTSGRRAGSHPVAATRRACPPGLLGREAAFLRILETAARHEMPDDGTLVVHDADGRTIVAAQE